VEGLAEVGAALLELLELWAGGAAFVGFAAGVASLWDMDYSRRLAQFGREG